MIWNCLPVVTRCCSCVKDLKTAVAIIATLGIVTSPAVSWAIVRHSYVIRVSCFITTHEERRDVVDIHLHNALSFGFGANAGLGPSCLSPKERKKAIMVELEARRQNEPPKTPKSTFEKSVSWVGWIVLIADLILLGYSSFFLYRLFQPKSPQNQESVTAQFMWACLVAILLSFAYSMLYITTCLMEGGVFPVFEFSFAIVDLLDNHITLKLLDDIQETELKELIPSLKDRILFKRGLKKLRNIIQATESDDTLSIDSDFSALGPTYSTSSDELPAILTLTQMPNAGTLVPGTAYQHPGRNLVALCLLK